DQPDHHEGHDNLDDGARRHLDAHRQLVALGLLLALPEELPHRLERPLEPGILVRREDLLLFPLPLLGLMRVGAFQCLDRLLDGPTLGRRWSLTARLRPLAARSIHRQTDCRPQYPANLLHIPVPRVSCPAHRGLITPGGRTPHRSAPVLAAWREQERLPAALGPGGTARRAPRRRRHSPRVG